MNDLFRGDLTYSINCTGDAVVGDQVCFDRAVFVGTYPKSRFDGYERIQGVIVSESYGATTGQHTFTIQVTNGEKIRIKGRNLYRNGLYRKKWDDETRRFAAQDEKHHRGGRARRHRAERMQARA